MEHRSPQLATTGRSADRVPSSGEARDLVSYHREVPRYVEQALSTWLTHRPPSFSCQVSLPRYSLSEATSQLPEPARSWLLVDMARCVASLAEAAQSDRFKVSFGPVHGNQCRKFHTDFVRYRLVRTYLGPGTQWVAPENVREDSPMRIGESPEEANRRVVHDLNDVHQAGPGDVLLLRGARHEMGASTLHRSPPIEGTGTARVVLIASTVHDT